MDIEKSFRSSLKLYASIVLIASSIHGVWHWFFPTYIEMEGLTKLQWNVFFVLNWSVSLFLFFLSILSFGISSVKSFTLNQLRAFSALMIGFWTCRFVLEFIFPVQIPFIIIPNPSLVFKLLIAIAITILILPEMRFWFTRRDRK